ncbi:hypothetical protein K458DRAFT_426779 [Lentithecium fluviatile CBS 122367]|uniref:Uncharacterized protein n=1 Tax=Lentithecium fluviatile CBS 122367 TaxID=1168545 RepID=A0A6G1JI43_9PLEO|nr:hypothetical protein K458DRAFT_426779 [Lentithecium fluviatile CBS 122367]
MSARRSFEVPIAVGCSPQISRLAPHFWVLVARSAGTCRAAGCAGWRDLEKWQGHQRPPEGRELKYSGNDTTSLEIWGSVIGSGLPGVHWQARSSAHVCCTLKNRLVTQVPTTRKGRDERSPTTFCRGPPVPIVPEHFGCPVEAFEKFRPKRRWQWLDFPHRHTSLGRAVKRGWHGPDVVEIQVLASATLAFQPLHLSPKLRFFRDYGWIKVEDKIRRRFIESDGFCEAADPLSVKETTVVNDRAQVVIGTGTGGGGGLLVTETAADDILHQYIPFCPKAKMFTPEDVCFHHPGSVLVPCAKIVRPNTRSKETHPC